MRFCFLTLMIFSGLIAHGQIEIKSIGTLHGSLRFVEIECTIYLFKRNKLVDSVYFDREKFYVGDSPDGVYTFRIEDYSKLQIKPDEYRYSYHNPKSLINSQFKSIKGGRLVLKPDRRYAFSGYHQNVYESYSFRGEKIKKRLHRFKVDSASEEGIEIKIKRILERTSFLGVYELLDVEYYWASVPSITAVRTSKGSNYFLINDKFYEQLEGNTVGVIGIFAHELFHLMQLNMDAGSNSINKELEAQADYFAGQILYEVFPEIEDLSALFDLIHHEGETDNYFAKEARMDTIMSGWNASRLNTISAEERACSEILNNAKYFYSSKKYRQVIIEINKYLKCASEISPIPYFLLVDSYSQINQPSKSKSVLTDIVSLFPANPKGWEKLGDTYLNLNNSDSAKLCYLEAEKLMEETRSKSNLLYKIGNLYFDVNDAFKGHEYLDKSIAIDDNDNAKFLKAIKLGDIKFEDDENLKLEKIKKAIRLLDEIINKEVLPHSQLKEVEKFKLQLRIEEAKIQKRPLDQEHIFTELERIITKYSPSNN